MNLVKYDAACHALAAARSVDEVKSIRDKAIAIKAYARQCKNKDLEADAFEIRKRAERRLGEMMAEQPKAQGKRTDLGFSKTQVGKTTLAEAGIDKNLADRARKAVAIPEDEFEALVANGRADVKRSAERAAEAKIARREKHQTIAARASSTLSRAGPFPLIYADPPWKWGHFGDQENENEKGKGRTPDQHYPTLTYEQIKWFRADGKPIADLAHKDAALFLWCTSSNIELALEVVEAWGFTYKTHAVWVKDSSGLGLVFRNRHELLLYGTRGQMPGPQYQPQSVFEFPRGRHSEKPEGIRRAIEKMYPDFGEGARLELFARGTVNGWTCYGFESLGEAAA